MKQKGVFLFAVNASSFCQMAFVLFNLI